MSRTPASISDHTPVPRRPSAWKAFLYTFHFTLSTFHFPLSTLHFQLLFQWGQPWFKLLRRLQKLRRINLFVKSIVLRSSHEPNLRELQSNRFHISAFFPWSYLQTPISPKFSPGLRESAAPEIGASRRRLGGGFLTLSAEKSLSIHRIWTM